VGAAFWEAIEALPILIFTLFVLVLAFSALIFMVEPEENIGTVPKAAYFAIVTMTTVGYGDVYPESVEGKVVVSALVVVSVLYMAMPLGIVGQAFNTVWNDRDRLLLVMRCKERLDQWGYTAHDVLLIFRWFDEDGNGNLDVDEFQSMVKHMRLGLKRKRVVDLFNSIDVDGGGSIDGEEFVKYLFPEDYAIIFKDKDGDKSEDGSEKEQDDDPDAENSVRKLSRSDSIDEEAGSSEEGEN
jgi:hypothetical protein